ncbi:redox-sensing transcriptional repressor Rex [Ligilactobacillus ceti]|uniref:Redox-sensing transcriptional repressor Rex n=1 Tax=Ligilactobacillus ceti DSM 22408 TaxID=1122146 RepID=A0A0R2KP18_9LACO|nr:redox-sensing transcriptional repressor Rex [Ligilactobacillus ceti]KRN88426.1 hypothetical protein IV53_GL000390 [Ligilactobacillus ceti DSM 22408]
MKETSYIPQATINRLPAYYRYLMSLDAAGLTRVSSGEIAKAVQVDSATIRRDFSYFGALGKRGYGYEVQSLLTFLTKILNQDKLTKVALIGLGNLGNALLNYQFHKSNNTRIAVAFDVKEEVVDTIQAGVPVYHIDKLVQQLELLKIEIAILTVPGDQAQAVTDQLVASGIKGILNFSPVPLVTPEKVRVQNVNLTHELQTLIYFLDLYQ